ncbi:MAG: hypothetical protein EAX81_06605 [Candidatus Thorarchaeota archaeon]|nr:hypothetical protein [Candidatus Thorarchaeota archaeon]
MSDVYVWYTTATGLEKSLKTNPEETSINLDLHDIMSIDLQPVIWCSKLEELSLRSNQLKEIDLSSLSKCKELKALRLNNNLLQSLNLAPLESCAKLQEITLNHNQIRHLDISPLFHCNNLVEMKLDERTSLLADLTLKSVGSWPDVLVERFHRILWKIPEET